MNEEYIKAISSITPEVVSNLRRAVEIGRWPNGQALTEEQRATCLQAIIAYEATHLPPEQRTGYVPPKKAACADDGDHQHVDEKPLQWQ